MWYQQSLKSGTFLSHTINPSVTLCFQSFQHPHLMVKINWPILAASTIWLHISKLTLDCPVVNIAKSYHHNHWHRLPIYIIWVSTLSSQFTFYLKWLTYLMLCSSHYHFQAFFIPKSISTIKWSYCQKFHFCLLFPMLIFVARCCHGSL